MKLEWTYTIDGKSGSTTWEDGVITGTPEVKALAEALVMDKTLVEIWYGMVFDTANLDKAETAWGTITHALHLLDVTIEEQPDPVFQPPEGIIY